MPRDESPADVLDGYAFDYGLDYFFDGDCPCACCQGTCGACHLPEVEKLCAEDAPEPTSRFTNRPRIRCRDRR